MEEGKGCEEWPNEEYSGLILEIGVHVENIDRDHEWYPFSQQP